jgi:hypothetical protein
MAAEDKHKSLDDESLDDESLDSQLEWELGEGIPQFEDPFVQKYMTGREALIKQEKRQRHGKFELRHFLPCRHFSY